MTTPEQAIDQINAVFGRHPGCRALHAKGRFYTGTFTASPEVAALSRAGHLQGPPVPVLVRWSNGGGDVRSDRAPDVRGMAVSFRLPDGTATDLLGQTAPRFPVRTIEAFLALVVASQKPTLPLFLLRHPNALPALLANLRAGAVIPPRSFAEVAYFPIHAYRWVAADGSTRWVRYVLRPVNGEGGRPEGEYEGRDRLFDEMAARLEAAPVRFQLEVHVAGEGDDPHDPMSVWKRDSLVVGGVIEVTAVAEDPEVDGNVVVFDPTRVVDGIELSDDPLLHFRTAAYSVSVDRRLS